jgi:flagellar hook-associated protein FlgK
MLRYQQAYLAASKVISVADNLFQNLLQIVGR